MKKIGLIAALALVAAVAAPSALAAPSAKAGDRARAVQDCKILRAQLGKQTFRATYGTANVNRKNAFAQCVRQWTAEERQNRREAVAECGAAGKGLGKCVAQKLLAESRADRRATVNAAKACKAERGTTAETREAFREMYGTNRNKSNAFGKCVSTLAKGGGDTEEPEAPEE